MSAVSRATMERALSSRRHRISWVFSVAGAVVAAVIVLGIGPPGVFLPRATVCQLGPAVGNYTIWTPTAIVNIPDGGMVSYNVSETLQGSPFLTYWNYTFVSGSLAVGTLPPGPIGSWSGTFEVIPLAGIYASYADFNWTFYRTENVSQVGVASNPCTQPYVAQFSLPAAGCESDFSIIPMANNSTDVMEPHVWNGTTGQNTAPAGCPANSPGTYVWFDSSFHPGGTGPATPVEWNLCSSKAVRPLFVTGLAQVPVTVTVPFGGGDISASGLLRWISQPGPSSFAPTVTYHVPGGWIWTLAPVGPVSGPIALSSSDLPGLVAFERSAC